MKPQIIIKPCSEFGIFREAIVREKFPIGTCHLLLISNGKEMHYVWGIYSPNRLDMVPVFEVDTALPQQLDGFQIRTIEENSLFFFRKKIYLLHWQNGEFEISEIDIFTTAYEVRLFAASLGLKNVKCHIAKASVIGKSKKQALSPIGYCWRVYNQQYCCTVPLFSEDFEKIRQYDYNELDFEEICKGELVKHGKELWRVYQDSEKEFFIVKEKLFQI